MHHICDYFKLLKDDSSKMKEAEEVVCEVLCYLESVCPNIYKDAHYKLHCIVYGEHFDDEMAETVVSELINADGSSSPHWKRSDTDVMANRLGIKERADFYVLVNHFFSLFCTVLGSDGNMYAKMAQSIINNHDGCIFKMYMLQ